ncbi:MAG: sugar-binding transcriptional regulator, partial [Rubrobacteraceae bacterium]
VQVDRKNRSDGGMLLLAEVARLYYVKHFTQQHIADRIGVSRTNVSRMLAEARARGLVEIRIHTPLTVESDLQDDLASRLGLRECLVLAKSPLGENSNDLTDTISGLSALGAQYLQENVPDDSVIGVSWSSTVHHVVSSGYLQEKNDVTAVQLMGSIGGSIVELDGVSITARAADVLGAKAYYLHAPMIVTSPLVRDGLMRDPHIRETLDVARNADTTVVSVGVLDQSSGQFRTGYLNEADLECIRDQGAIGDISGAYFSQNGEEVPLERNDRTIALEFESLRRIPNRIGVSGGPQKALPNIGAIRAGLLNVLITDESTALEMISLLDSENTPPKTSI